MRREIIRWIFVIISIGVIVSYTFLDYNSLLYKLSPTKPIKNDDIESKILSRSLSNSSFIIGITAWMTPDCDADAQLMVDAGINYVRLPVSWKNVEPTKGNFNFTYYNRVFDCLDKYNLSYMVVLEYWIPPAWAQEKWNIPPFYEYTDTLADKSFIEAYTEFVTNTVENFKGRVKIYQITNELNNDLGIRLGIKKEMKKASEFIKLGFDTVKKVDPNVTVTAGISTSRNWKVFLKYYLVDNEDIISLQTYKPLNEIHKDSLFLSQFRKPVIITETGISMCPGYATAEEQADFVYNVIRQAYSDGLYGVFIFMYRDDNCPELCNVDLGHCMGIIDGNNHPKPAYYSLKKLVSEIV